jgi:hypothetical protein
MHSTQKGMKKGLVFMLSISSDKKWVRETNILYCLCYFSKNGDRVMGLLWGIIAALGTITAG